MNGRVFPKKSVVYNSQEHRRVEAGDLERKLKVESWGSKWLHRHPEAQLRNGIIAAHQEHEYNMHPLDHKSIEEAIY